MDDTFEAIDGFVTKMSRQIRDLDDVRFAMEALKVILYQGFFSEKSSIFENFHKIFRVFSCHNLIEYDKTNRKRSSATGDKI